LNSNLDVQAVLPLKKDIRPFKNIKISTNTSVCKTIYGYSELWILFSLLLMQKMDTFSVTKVTSY